MDARLKGIVMKYVKKCGQEGKDIVWTILLENAKEGEGKYYYSDDWHLSDMSKGERKELETLLGLFDEAELGEAVNKQMISIMTEYGGEIGYKLRESIKKVLKRVLHENIMAYYNAEY